MEQNYAYLVIQFYRQHHAFVVLHSYLLEQLVSAAPRKWVLLCLAYGIDWPSHPRGGAMLPPAHSLACNGSWAWHALVSVIILPAPAVPINHTYKFSYNCHMKPKSFYTCLTLWAHDTLHMHIYKLWFLFLFFLPFARQVSWPDPSCREQLWKIYQEKKSLNSSPSLKFILQNTLYKNCTEDKFYCGDCIQREKKNLGPWTCLK